MKTSVSAADPIAATWMHIPADDIAREHTADELCILAGSGLDMNRWRLPAGGDMKMSTFTGIDGDQYEQSRDRWRRGLREMLANETSAGACFHEYANVYYFNLWDEIAEAVAEVQ